MAPAKRALLEARLRKARRTVQGEPPIAPRDPAKPARMAVNQAQLWYLDEFQRGTSTYTINKHYRLRGPLDLRALTASLTTIVSRHDSLRMTFPAVGGQAVPKVDAAGPVQLPLQDLSGLTAGAREAAARRHVWQFSHAPFDLEAGPLARFEIVRLAADDHLLLVQMHHIISDGWSFGVFARELSEFYTAGIHHQPPAVTGPALQYRDFVAWQHDRLESGALETQLTFWEANLREAPALLELPGDRPHSGNAIARAGEVKRLVDASRYRRLQEIAAGENTSPFTVLLAAFQVLLQRMTGQDDIVVGTPFAGRNHSALEHLIGYFVNVLPLRGRLEGSLPFTTAVQRARETLLQAVQHQDVPFARLVERLKPPRLAGRNPIFQVAFVFQGGLTDEPTLDGLTVESLPNTTESAKFDVTLYVTESGRGVELTLEYNADMYDAPTAARLLARFDRLLESIAAGPGTPINRLAVLPEAERSLLLETWNRTHLEHPAEPCTPDLLAEQVARTPNTVALVAGDESLTYRELDTRANRLANHLRSLGVAQEQLIGVCLDRTADLIIALLGIHKAGCAYVPLDPAYPRDRLAYVVSDARVAVVLTHERWRDLFVPTEADTTSRRVVCVDTERRDIAAAAATRPPTRVHPEQLSHVIYTSGSTGRPKGVALEHRNVTAFLHWARAWYSSAELKGVLASTSVCFDLSVFEIFVPLCWGGTIHLVDNALALPQLPADCGITLLNTVPSAAAALLRVGGIPSSVSVVNLAGEPLPVELVDQLYARPHIEKVFDLYGPTEDTVYSTGALRRAHVPATIGRPLPNKQLYLLDAFLEPVPIGAPGEIYIGGTGVARGYLNQPQLTAERFLPDRFRPESGTRLYKTGDLARFRSDGQIEFLGRSDHQVKIRGFRIELGEIETVLRRHAAVAEATVVARADGTERRIVAYVVRQSGSALTGEDLRQYLRTQLPDYMVPAAFVFLPAMPLTPNGKIDRRQLPAPEPGESGTERVIVAPRNTREEQLAAIWRDLLPVEEFGVHDGFFELGGHSLLAMRLVHEIRQLTGQTLPLADLFAAPTIAELAARLDEPARVAVASEGGGALRGTGAGTPLYFIPGLGGFEFAPAALSRALAGSARYYDTLQFRGADGKADPRDRVEEIAADLVEQIRSVRPEGPYNLCGFCFGGVVAYEVARQLTAAGAEVPALVIWHGYPTGTWPNRTLGAAMMEMFVRFARGTAAQRWRMVVDKVRFMSLTAKRRMVDLAYRMTGRDHPNRVAGVEFLPAYVDRKVVAANLRAHHTYKPKPYSGRTFLVLGDTDRLRYVCPPKAGWDGLLVGPVEMFKLPVEHLELTQQPHIELVARQTVACLDAAGKRAPAWSTTGFVSVSSADEPAC